MNYYKLKKDTKDKELFYDHSGHFNFWDKILILRDKRYTTKDSAGLVLVMSHVRKCTRAYHEYRLELFPAIENALREYSEQWEWIVDNLFKPKCEVFGYCDESKSCGRKPKRQ